MEVNRRNPKILRQLVLMNSECFQGEAQTEMGPLNAGTASIQPTVINLLKKSHRPSLSISVCQRNFNSIIKTDLKNFRVQGVVRNF